VKEFTRAAQGSEGHSMLCPYIYFLRASPASYKSLKKLVF